jgi:Fe2+ or Zn2+ uptake regulation protein
VVRRANDSDAVARFDGNTDHHHHLVCLGCARVSDFIDFKLDRFVLPNARHTGFEIADYSIHFRVIARNAGKRFPDRPSPGLV